jgi:hypothetical protein
LCRRRVEISREKHEPKFSWLAKMQLYYRHSTRC